VIQLVLVDDHPALRAGLMGVLRAEPGLAPLASVSSADELWPELARSKPQVVVLDYHLPGEDGLAVCRQVKRLIPAPAVLLYSAYASASLVVPARVAGADGVLHKAAPAAELYDAVRMVARGESVMPPLSRTLVDEAVRKIDDHDVPVLMMRLDGASGAEIAESMRWDPEDVAHSIDRILHRLRLDVPAAAASTA
jgi:DNA-binding NarL/FixJ family response regulator